MVVWLERSFRRCLSVVDVSVFVGDARVSLLHGCVGLIALGSTAGSWGAQTRFGNNADVTRQPAEPPRHTVRPPFTLGKSSRVIC